MARHREILRHVFRLPPDQWHIQTFPLYPAYIGIPNALNRPSDLVVQWRPWVFLPFRLDTGDRALRDGRRRHLVQEELSRLEQRGERGLHRDARGSRLQHMR